MPYYEAIASYHLGRFMADADPDRIHRLKTAAVLFDKIGATFDAERARQALVSESPLEF